MSFSAAVKRELSCVSLKNSHCNLAELSGMIYMAGMITLGSGGLSLKINTENNDVVRRAIALFKSVFSIHCQLSKKTGQLKKKDTFVIQVSGRETVLGILKEIGLCFSGGIRLVEDRFLQIVEEDCCQKSFLRGAFLGSGSISDPTKIYHLEFVVNLKEFAQPLLNILNRQSLPAKLSHRKDDYIVYLKEIEGIITFLTLTGAHASVLELENIRILKEIRNNVNRRINCDNANIDRTVRSGTRQAEDIRLIAQEMGLEALPPALKEAAELRLAHPEASLIELADLSGGISRSGMNHRLKKLEQIAHTLRNAKEE